MGLACSRVTPQLGRQGPVPGFVVPPSTGRVLDLPLEGNSVRAPVRTHHQLDQITAPDNFSRSPAATVPA
jgi:hypothetical protein